MKLAGDEHLGGLLLSHPTRVRGLKPVMYESGLKWRRVAPHAGAWIET